MSPLIVVAKFIVGDGALHRSEPLGDANEVRGQPPEHERLFLGSPLSRSLSHRIVTIDGVVDFRLLRLLAVSPL